MEELVLSKDQYERYIYEALEDYGFGYPGEMIFRTVIGEDSRFHFELDINTYYKNEKTIIRHFFAIKDFIELLKYALNKNGYDIYKVAAYVRHDKLKVKVQTKVPYYYVPKKRRK